MTKLLVRQGTLPPTELRVNLRAVISQSSQMTLITRAYQSLYLSW